jgi:hypothetical protein
LEDYFVQTDTDWKAPVEAPLKNIFEINEPAVRQVPSPEPQRRLPAPAGGATKLIEWLDKKRK